jgi:tetratricopeptide (TPR) repeat protein
MIVPLYNQLAVIYRDAGDYQQALRYGTLSKNVFDSSDLSHEPFLTIGSIYLLTNQIDSASFYINKSYELNKKYPFGWLLYALGEVEAKKKHYVQALHYYRAAIPIGNNFDRVYTYNDIARLYQETGNIDSSIYYAKKVHKHYADLCRFTTRLPNGEQATSICLSFSTAHRLQSLALNSKLRRPIQP